MKSILTLFFFCFTITFLSQNVTGNITYEFSRKPISDKKIDSIKKNSKVKDVKMHNWMRNILKNSTPVYATLVFTNSESLYTVNSKMENDGKPVFNINTTFAGGDDKYYKNRTTEEFYHQSDVFGNLSLIDLPIKKWKITQETKIIGGYTCYKAIDLSYKSKTTFAWFTPEIPVNFGPKNFVGLPGLILEVVQKKRKIKATKITLNPKIKININKPIKGDKVSVDEAQKRYSSFWKSIEKQ